MGPAGITLELKLPPHSPLIVQPPADDGLGDAAMTHYTWGTLINDPTGKRVWEFDKRTYTAPEIQTKVTHPPRPTDLDVDRHRTDFPGLLKCKFGTPVCANPARFGDHEDCYGKAFNKSEGTT
jgi:hypothetical protein